MAAKSVEKFEKLEQIGEGTYGQAREGAALRDSAAHRPPGVEGAGQDDERDCGAQESADGQRRVAARVACRGVV